jgi:hypothetical protein
MIEIFESWFNQFTKDEQVKLLEHIKRQHFNMGNEQFIGFSKNEKTMDNDLKKPKNRIKQIV